MCQHFANGKAHGNLCRSFCVSNSLIPKNCQTFHVGKEVVFSANFDDLPVSIFKIFGFMKIVTFLSAAVKIVFACTYHTV